MIWIALGVIIAGYLIYRGICEVAGAISKLAGNFENLGELD